MEKEKELLTPATEPVTADLEKTETPKEEGTDRRQGGPRRGGPRRGGPRRPGGRRPRQEEKKEFEERVVSINRVSKTLKGGRRMRFAAVTVIGDGKGRYGYAHAKAAEVPDAIKKSLEAAKKDLRKVEIVEGDTIAHEVVGQFGACRVFLKPAPDGTGVIAGGPVRAILELAGIRNVYSKVYGSRNPLNVIRATVAGLSSLKSRATVEALRGLK